MGGVGIRKHFTDVAQRCRAQDGVGDSVGNRIAIRMTGQREIDGDLRAGQDQRTTWSEPVGVVTETNT